MRSFVRKAAICAASCALVLGVLGMAGCSSDSKSSSSASSSSNASASSKASSSTQATTKADPIGTHHAVIEIEGYDPITVELDGDTAPITVQNFMDLANSGFYDGLTFHRIMEGFMMQGGDPLGNGTGGSDETIVGEFSDNGYDNDISHKRGVISMARSQMPDSASSQFFIVQQDSDFLDGQYAAFGHVTEGMETVDAICETATPTDNNGTIPKDAQPIITSIKITD